MSKRASAATASATAGLVARVAGASSPTLAEYAVALGVLGEATLSQACALLLSDADYRQSSEETTRMDRDRLRALYAQCKAASDVVGRYADAEWRRRPNPKHNRSIHMAAAAGSKTSNSQNSSTTNTSSNHATNPASVLLSPAPPPPLLKHNKGDTLRGGGKLLHMPVKRGSFTGVASLTARGIVSSASVAAAGHPTTSSLSSFAHHKKKWKPSPPSSSSSSSTSPPPPPASALHFLAALNKTSTTSTHTVASTTLGNNNNNQTEPASSKKRARPSDKEEPSSSPTEPTRRSRPPKRSPVVDELNPTRGTSSSPTELTRRGRATKQPPVLDKPKIKRTSSSNTATQPHPLTPDRRGTKRTRLNHSSREPSDNAGTANVSSALGRGAKRGVRVDNNTTLSTKEGDDEDEHEEDVSPSSGRPRRAASSRIDQTKKRMEHNSPPKRRIFEVGEDVYVIWEDGKHYEAIIRDVDYVDDAHNVSYTVEYDNGEVAENIDPDDIVEPID